MKYNKNEIITLREQGYTIRQIMKKLNILSPSTVQHHIKHINKYEKLMILPERTPIFNNKESEYMCAGFNEYRKIMAERLKNLA